MLQKKRQWSMVLTICITMIFLGGGCTNKQTGQAGNRTESPSSHSAGMLVANEVTFSNVRVYSDINGLVWVPLEETVNSIGLDLHNAGDRYDIGNTDVAYSVNVNQTQALDGDHPIELPHAPRMMDHKPYMTTEALSALLGTRVSWNADHPQVVIVPVDHNSLSAEQSGANAEQQMQGLSINKVDKSGVISYAKKFIGTPYQFGAGPYDSTHKFDCSSFVRYVYAHFGVNLPRSSRSQAGVGQTVAVDQLQPGDLMFFRSAGRNVSNRIVTHVGIYAGNGQIVHTFGAPGVTVTDFKQNWRNRFLFGKRVA